jgi:CheY-like chemotaxis protein
MTVEHTRLKWIRAESARIKDVVVRTHDILVAAKELLSRPAPDTFAGRRTHDGHEVKAECVGENRGTLTQVSPTRRTRSYGARSGDEGEALSEPPAVLVVEDEFYLAADIEEALTDAGFAIYDVVSSGEDALALINGTVAYRALVTDVSLGGSVSGWDIARRIREREPAFPVVYVTSAPAEEWVSQGVPNSILISKPFVRALLVAAVANLLNIVTPSAA